jgi:hypothetical protein
MKTVMNVPKHVILSSVLVKVTCEYTSGVMCQ